MKIQDLREQLEDDPQDLSLRAELVAECVNEGYWDDIIPIINAVPHKGSHRTLRHFLRPVLQTIRDQGQAQYLGPVLKLLDWYDEDDTVAMKWLKKGRKDIEKRFHGGVFPSDVPYRNWWSSGPHTQKDTRSWTPGRIIELSDERATLFLMSRENNGFLSVSEITINREGLNTLTEGQTFAQNEGDLFEMFSSSDGDSTGFVFHS